MKNNFSKWLGWKITKMKDNFSKWLAWKLPDKVVYWCGFRIAAYASSGEYKHDEVPAITMIDALSRWEKFMNPKQRNVQYIIGEEHTDEHYGIWFGPVETEQECLDQIGKSNKSQIIRLQNMYSQTLWKWKDEIGWVKQLKESKITHHTQTGRVTTDKSNMKEV